MIVSVARSVMTIIEPSGVKPTWADSVFSAESGRSASMSGSSRASLRRKPVTDGVPVFSTYTMPSRSARLFGAAPPEPTVWISSGRVPSTRKTLTSSLATLVTSR
jgi:hypothetical protein